MQEPGKPNSSQEAILAAKYGGLKPKNVLLAKVRSPQQAPAQHAPSADACPNLHPSSLSQEHKYFDSADWALAKEANKEQAPATAVHSQQQLPLPQPRPAAVHRLSKLESTS
jgi:hypothetical protein